MEYKLADEKRVSLENDNEDEEAKICKINKYLESIKKLFRSIDKNDIVEIHQNLILFWDNFESSSIVAHLEDLRIFEIIQKLMTFLRKHVDDCNPPNAILIEEIFHTFNVMLFKKAELQIRTPLQLFSNTSLLNYIFKVIVIPEDKLMFEIIQFLRLIDDKTSFNNQCIIENKNLPIEISEEEQKMKDFCFFFEFSVINTDSFQSILRDHEIFSPGTFVQCSCLIDQLSDRKNATFENWEFVIFTDAIFFIEMPNKESNIHGFRIIYNLVSLNENITQSLILHSDPLRNSVARLLKPETDVEIIHWIIAAVGMMCLHNYTLVGYDLNSLTQFLKHSEEETRKLAAFALANAIASNGDQFSVDDRFEIASAMIKIIQNDNFNVISFLGESFLHVFNFLPPELFQRLGENELFDAFYRLMNIDSLMKSPNAVLIINCIDSLFNFADSNFLFVPFASAFENSLCYEFLASFDCGDQELKKRIDTLLFNIDSRKNAD